MSWEPDLQGASETHSSSLFSGQAMLNTHESFWFRHGARWTTQPVWQAFKVWRRLSDIHASHQDAMTEKPGSDACRDPAAISHGLSRPAMSFAILTILPLAPVWSSTILAWWWLTVNPRAVPGSPRGAKMSSDPGSKELLSDFTIFTTPEGRNERNEEGNWGREGREGGREGKNGKWKTPINFLISESPKSGKSMEGHGWNRNDPCLGCASKITIKENKTSTWKSALKIQTGKQYCFSEWELWLGLMCAKIQK